MKYFYSLVLCASLMFSACTVGEDDPVELKLSEGMPTEIVVGDDGTTNVKEIKFVASSSWSATIKNVSENRADGSEVEWLELDKYNGQAGENSIILYIENNETSEIRKAEIIIQCGDVKITIIVEQEPKSDENQGSEDTDSELVKSINITTINNPEDAFICKFTYDGNGRVIKMSAEPVDGGLPRQTYSMVYTDNKLEITEDDEQVVPTESAVRKYEVELNADGDSITMYDVEKNGSKKLSYDFGYDKDGRLTQIQNYYSGELSSIEKITYENGLFKSYEYDDFKTGQDSESFEYVVDLETAYNKKYPNTGFDKVSLLLQPFGDSYYMLYFIGVMGKTSDYLPESARFVRTSSNEEDKFNYEFDNKGRVTKMTIDESDWGGNLDRTCEFIY